MKSVSGGSMVRETLKALLLPKRLLPIVLVCIPLIVAQGSFSRDRLAIPLAVAMCIAFVVVAPLSWRILFPFDSDSGQPFLRLLLYSGVGAGTVLTLGVVIPQFVGMGATFLTHRASLLVSGALFLVGGWGLARDIGLDASLERERSRSAALEREAEQAQLLALRAHLDPHFLFNTLNAIAEWCREDGETAERAVLQLSAILRAVLDGVKLPAWPLQKEIELSKTLLSLHQMRDPTAFSVEYDLPTDIAAIPVLPMILLPLAENAVKHGPASGHRGPITLKVTSDGQLVHIYLANPGPYRGPRKGSDGLPTVERRLELAYSGRAKLRITGDTSRTTVEVEFPAQGPNSGIAI